MKRFEGKVVLITGGRRGIGYETARCFAAEGASVAIADIGEPETVQAARQIEEESGAKTAGLALNVASEKECESAVEKVISEFSKIDVLVNNAGITRDNLVLRMKEKDFMDVIDVNLKGAFLMSKAAAKTMLRQRGGRIINIASVAGQSGNPGQANYSASKAGLIGLTRSMAREFASRGVLVNAVAPGFIATKMTEDLKEEAKAKLLEIIPLGRFGAAADVAKTVLFLAGGDADYITGQVIAVNGGMYM